MIEALLQAFVFMILLSPLLLLAAYAKVRGAEARKALEKENERRKRVKDLYPDPDPPSYEERMGVLYGPQGASGATGGADNG